MRHGLQAMCIIAILAGIACGDTTPGHNSLSGRGSIGFWFYVDSEYYNGVQPRGELTTLLEAPNILHVILDSPSVSKAASQAEFGAKEDKKSAGEKPPSSVVNFEMAWDVPDGNRLNLYLPQLPGSAWYYCAFRWDSAKGVFDGFLNGIPLRVPGTTVKKWQVAEQPVDFTTGDNVKDLEISRDFWTEETIRSRVQKRDHVDVGPLIGFGKKTPMQETESLKGTLLFSPDFAKKGAMDNWRMEGPGVFTTADGWLSMESTEADVGGPGDGHIVFWTPGIIPSNFIAEWDFQPLTDEGLCIVLFSAMGQNGENIFDPSLKKRDGHFAGYIRGDINCYHISYYANIPTNPGRITSNLRKNHGFYLVANGPPAVPNGSKQTHKITLIKNNGNIRLGVDGLTIIDWTDDGRQYGPVHGQGSLALRQMKWMKARYRNFKIWEIPAGK